MRELTSYKSQQELLAPGLEEFEVRHVDTNFPQQQHYINLLHLNFRNKYDKFLTASKDSNSSESFGRSVRRFCNYEHTWDKG